MSTPPRQRVDVWLFRTRLLKTRAAAARMVAEGGVRLVHGGQARRLEKPSAEVACGDALVFALGGRVRTLEVMALPTRRGPAAEARLSYRDQEGDLPP
ncbi:MAG: RNA-binding S4 domain-containing protein [Hyphomonadaceae bacterium]|nr:RNA-binding S4 domain-containing protein [Hyphomonadaceae bacterium]MBX3509622.1 RNA-binding S4 domain-containing protein [Hyphomonadaceae bacterium]